MSIPFLPIHPHPHPQRLMSKTYRRRLRRQQAGVQAPQGGPDTNVLEHPVADRLHLPQPAGTAANASQANVISAAVSQ